MQLKVCAIGGAQALVRRVRLPRSQGSASTSLILEAALAHLLGSASSAGTLADARRRYDHRRAVLGGALIERGLSVGAEGAGEGPFLRIEVADETWAMVQLSARGISASPGSICRALPFTEAGICLTVSQVPDDVASPKASLASGPTASRPTR